MSTRRIGRCAWLLLGLLGCTGRPEAPPSATQTPAMPKTPLPSVDPETAVVFAAGAERVTLAELARAMGEPPQLRLRMTEHERRLAFLDEFVRTELLALTPQAQSYLASPELQRARRSMLVQRLLGDLFGPNGSQVASVTDADVKAYYDAHADRWRTPAQVRARQILLHDAARAASVLAQLKEHPTDPYLFAKLAHEQSLDARTRERGGDLGRFSLEVPPPPAADAVTTASLMPPVVPASVRAAAFALAHPGDLVASPIKSELGYHVVQLLDRQPPNQVQLPQVAHMLEDQVRQERQNAAIEAFTKSLEDDAHVLVNEAALARVRVTP